MMTVLDVLENALYNLRDGTQPFQKRMGIEQLENAIERLEETNDIYDNFMGTDDAV